MRRAWLPAALTAVAVALAACTTAVAQQPEEKVLYLTFDDGPSRATTEILDVLRTNDADATFFTTGEELLQHQDIARRAIAQGNVVAAHTFSHLNLTKLGSARLARQLERSMAALREVGSDSDCLRPPYGAVNDTVKQAMRERGLQSVLWNVDPKDWNSPGASTIADRIVSNAYPGAVVLLHDGGGDRSQTVRALRMALPKLRAQGYEFEPVPGC